MAAQPGIADELGGAVEPGIAGVVSDRKSTELGPEEVHT
jgi:hypothetical protein